LALVPRKQTVGPRIGLATLVLALGVAVLVMADAAAERANLSWTRRTRASQTYTVVRQREGALGWNETERLVRDIDGVHEVVAVLGGTLSADETSRSGWVSVSWMACDSDVAREAYPSPGPGVTLWRGDLPAPGVSDEAVLGYEFARLTGLDVGDAIMVRGYPFTVGAIWSPSYSEPGNFVQLPVATVRDYFSGADVSRSHLMVYIQTGYDVEEVAHSVWERVPGIGVSSPVEMTAKLRAETRMWHAVVVLLCLWAFGAGLLTLVYTFARSPVPTEAGSVGLRVLGMTTGTAGLAAITGVICGGLVALGLNAYGQSAYARTFFFLTPRTVMLGLGLGLTVGIASAVWVLVDASLPRDSGQLRRVGRGLHWGLAVLVLASGTCLLVAGGSYRESLYSSLGEVRRIAARRVGLRLLRPSTSFLSRVSILPGVEGLTVEAYGGAVNEDEDGWGDRIPPSGVVYGLASDGGGPGMSLNERSGLWKGTGVQAHNQNEAVLGFDLAAYHQLDVGDTLTVRGSQFSVVGIRERCDQGVSAECNWRIDVSLDALRRITQNPQALDSVALFVPPVDREELREAFLLDLARRVPEAQVVSLGTQMDEVAAEYPMVTCLAADLQTESAQRARLMYSIGCVILAVALSVGMAATIWSAVGLDLHWQRERVALEMALGAAEGSILSAQALSAAAWSALGALAGAVTARWLVQAANALIDQLSMDVPRLLASARLLTVAGIWTVVLTILVALPPTLRGLKDDPLRLLVRAGIPTHEGAE